MLNSLRRASLGRKQKKLNSIERIEKNAEARRRERGGNNHNSDPVASMRRLEQDLRVISSYRKTEKKTAIRRRRVRLAQRVGEEYVFKKWLRNPRLLRKMERAKQRRKILASWFNFLDDDGSGEISRNEIGGPLISLGLAKNMNEVDKLIASVDKDGSGDIDFDEFEAMLVNGKAEPIQKLLKTLVSGSLGDPSVSSVKSLMTTARRRRIVSTLHGYGKPKPGDRRYGMISLPDDVKFDRRLLRELQDMEMETMKTGNAVDREAHIDRLVAARKQTAFVAKLDVENAEQHEHDVDQVMHSVVSETLSLRDNLPKLVERRFPPHHSRVTVLSKGKVHRSEIQAANRRLPDEKKKKKKGGMLSSTI